MRTCLLVLTVAALGFAPAPLPRHDRGRPGGDPLSGTWVVKTIKHANATHWGGAGLCNIVVSLSAEVKFSDREMQIQDRWEKNSRRLDVELRKGLRQVDFLEQSTRRTPAIYRVEGQTLTICYPTGTGKPRPASFDDPNDILIILERKR
jgi:uncharacterized protein (TIGR03067 family)